jgi:hypothetical protein
MKFPFVSRDRFEEMRDFLKTRLEDAERINKLLTDRLIQRDTGRPLYEEPQSHQAREVQPAKSELEQALRISGSRLPSKVARAMTYVRATRLFTPNPVGKAVNGLDEAVAQGRQDAELATANR